jgi:hypothetical protein
MGKARQLIALARRKEFFLRLGATFIAVVGAVSAILGIVDRHFEVGTAVLLAGVTLGISALLNYRSLISPQVAVDDVITFDVGPDAPAQIFCPCDLATANEAKKLAQHCYAVSITIEPDKFEQMRAKNPYILACLKDHKGRFLGYFDAIPLRPQFAQPFLAGLVTESQITHEDVLSPEKLATCKYLFISGLAVRDPNTHAGRRNASMLVWGLLKYLDRFYGSIEPRVFALAATKEGDDLLERFKITLRSEGSNRVDGYKLYSIPLTTAELAKRLACVPDWGKLCILSWSPDTPMVKGGKRPRRPPLPETKAWNLVGDGALAQSQ